ncbi:putative secreted protein [Kitasatospora sp. GAS204A]|uniref:hypothetical protein n=1 Tax=unclassified Kitasatospora TaxID=2633591 RepID=UPI0024731964|nr:hypothetical protein [Kitasatospora sp. GAS204B]MDH6122016.1 putative secreted protein [Kitasatospora sp. GAS204B]
MTLIAILDRHLAQPRTAHDDLLIQALTALKAVASDQDALLYEIDRRITEADREQYAMTMSSEPETPELWQRVELIRTCFLGLTRLEREIKAAL